MTEHYFYQWRVKHAGPRAYRIGRLALISRTDFNASLPQRKIVRMSEERRRPSRLTPATCRRGPHNSGRPLWLAEFPSLGRNGNV